MAFGFPPKYSETVHLYGPDTEHFLLIALEAAKRQGWNISIISSTGFVAYTRFSWRSWSEKVTVSIEHSAAHIRSECTGNQVFDSGKNKRNIEQLLECIDEVRITLTQEAIDTGLESLRTDHNTFADEQPLFPPGGEQGNGFLALFKPREGYFMTPVLAGINILIYLIMVFAGVNIFQPDNQSLIDWGANFRPLTLEGEWWRLLTACFIHIGVLHLLLNMYALLYIGLLLEPYLGKTRFLAAYLLSGIFASLTSLWWHDLTVSAGASGAIFGMYGVFLALLTTSFIERSAKRALLASIAFFVVYNILNGLKPGSGIDNAAHIGGLLGGLVTGYALMPSLRQYHDNTVKFSIIGMLTIILLFTGFYTFRNLPNDIVRYDEKMQRFVSLESMAMEVLQRPAGTPDELLLSELRERGIYYWKESLEIMEEIEHMKLPDALIRRNIKMKEYCELRIKSYELLYKSIAEHTDQYDSEINNYVQKIDAIIRELTTQQ